MVLADDHLYILRLVVACRTQHCLVGRCLFQFGMFGRENDVRYVGFHCYLVVSLLAHVYADKLYLIAGQLAKLCQFHVRTECLGELVLGEAYGQYEAIPLVLVEGLVEV